MNIKPIVAALVAAGFIAAPVAHAASDAERIAQLERQLKLMQEQLDELKKHQAAGSAKEVADLRDQMDAAQKESVVAGDISGSYRIPGSDTSVRVYGIAELNYVKEFKGDNTDNEYSTALPYVPLNGSAGAKRSGQSYMHARTSRLGVEGAMPSAYGQLGVKIEGDFNNNRGGSNGSSLGTPGAAAGYTNGYQFRLRHAYLTMGPWLFGQTWGTFMDVDNAPETVDFNGPNGNTTLRQPMVRYTYATPENGNFVAALENSSSYVLMSRADVQADNGTSYGGGTVYGAGKASSKNPDLVLRWDKPFNWGALSFAVVSHELRVDDGTGAINASRRGTGLRASGQIKSVGDDLMFWNLTGGSGIGRYMNGIEGAGYDNAGNRIVLERAVGLTLGYQHRVSDQLRLNFVYGAQRSQSGEFRDWAVANDFASGTGVAGQYALNRKLDQVHVGGFWAPVKPGKAGATPPVELGLEYIWGRRETIAGERGDMSRVNFLARYNIN
jgi:hypothetical protein